MGFAQTYMLHRLTSCSFQSEWLSLGPAWFVLSCPCMIFNQSELHSHVCRNPPEGFRVFINPPEINNRRRLKLSEQARRKASITAKQCYNNTSNVHITGVLFEMGSEEDRETERRRRFTMRHAPPFLLWLGTKISHGGWGRTERVMSR